MIDFQLAPFIIAGVLVVCGYMFTRWLTVVGIAKARMRVIWRQSEALELLQAEGCAARGVLENIFNGVTASGQPHSTLVKKVEDMAAEALVEVPSCDHKAQAEDLADTVHSLEEELVAVDAIQTHNDELVASLATHKLAAETAMGRAEEAERLLGLVNDKLVVEKSYDQQADEKLQ